MQYCTDLGYRQRLTDGHRSDLREDLLHITQRFTCHTHPHASTLLGALFALSGLRALLITAVPIVQSESVWLILLYLGVFGLGIVVSMTVWGLAVGSALRGERSGHWVSLTLSLSSVALGIYWIGAA